MCDPREFVGEIIAPPGMTRRRGRATFPRRTFREQAVATDGTVKPFEELLQLYKGAKVVDGSDEVSRTVASRAVEPHLVRLKYLLGVKKVRTTTALDRVGNLVGAPIAKGSGVKTAAQRRSGDRGGSGREPRARALGIGLATRRSSRCRPLRHSRPLPPFFFKAEWLNPGGSVKDRAALYILRDGMRG